MGKDYYKFCLEAYQSEYKRAYDTSVAEYKGRTIPSSKLDEIDRDAQKSAIRISITKALTTFPDETVAELWNSIYRAHLFRKSGISDLDTINKVISADQSWKKSSGHAFEEMLKELLSLSLHDTGISVLLQRDLNVLIKANELSNEPRDLSWLREQIKANIFDLYGVINQDSKQYCFACFQAKTSVRDRVTRDREPSIHAMESFFWSAIFVLDGDFVRMPKFINMVNGGSEEFRENGWHGMYVFSLKNTNDRIYPLAMDFDIFKSHALQAAEQWQKRRQWFDRNWKAQ